MGNKKSLNKLVSGYTAAFIKFAMLLFVLMMFSACGKSNADKSAKDNNIKNSSEAGMSDKSNSISVITADDAIILQGKESEDAHVSDVSEDNQSGDELSDDSIISKGTSKADGSEIEGNGHYFVKYGDKVYFHVPTETGMNGAALWGKYSREECGETALCASDMETGETEVLFNDESKGVMNICGTRLMFTGKDHHNGKSLDTISQYSLTGEKCNVNLISEPAFLGGDKEGHYVVGSYYVYSDAKRKDGVYVQPVKDGKILEPIYMQDGMDYIGVDKDKLFYVYSEYDDSRDEIDRWLVQTDLDNGEMLTLGILPGFEFGSGVSDQVYFSDGKIYFSFGNYQGSGNFYCEGYFISATIDKKDSVEYEHDGGNIEENISTPFRVENGRMIPCEGVPGSAKVIDDSIGYFDEKGKYVKVSTGGYKYYAESEEGPVKEIELCEKIGDYIYAVRNISERAPDEDVGWRYAYRRLQTEIIRINITSGKEEKLFLVKRPGAGK